MLTSLYKNLYRTQLRKVLFLALSVTFTGSIARSAKRRYLIYTEADFEVFRPAGATRYTDGGEIWRGGGPNFTQIGARKTANFY